MCVVGEIDLPGQVSLWNPFECGYVRPVAPGMKMNRHHPSNVCSRHPIRSTAPDTLQEAFHARRLPQSPELREGSAIDRSAPHRAIHVSFKGRLILAHQLRACDVKRVARIRLVEEQAHPVDDRVQIQHRLPILSQDVDANAAILVEVRVVARSRQRNLWGLVWVTCLEGDPELVSPPFP